MRAVVNSDSLTVKIMSDGLRGRAGLQIELMGEDGKLFWRYENETVWKELIDVNDALQVLTREEIITLLGFEPAQFDHTHSAATHVAAGFMTPADKEKLDQVSIDEIKGKMDKPTGTVGQFLDGTGNPQDFPPIPEPAPQVNSDWNATAGVARILNKPVLGSAALVNIDRFATALQGQLAESALQAADIANKMDKPNGTADQFINGLGELANFADFTQVNSDWNATTGAAMILNKPALASAAFRPATDFASNNHTHAIATDGSAGFMSAENVTKLESIQLGATLNSSDEFLLNRANHTGSIAQSSVTGLTQELSGKLDVPTGTADDYIDGTGAVRVFPLGKPIFILASGQSNMANMPYDEAHDFEFSPNIHYWNFVGWENNVGTDFRSVSNRETGTAVSFAHQVARANPASEVYVLNVSFGGTSITAWTENQPIAAGTTVMANMDAFTARLTAMGVTDWVFDYFLWWQGEEDASQTESWYMPHFERWMDLLDARPEFDRWQARTVIFGINDAPNILWGNYAAMNFILRNVVNSMGGQAQFVPSASLGADFWGDDVHLNAVGYYEIGKRAYIAAHGGGEVGMRFMKDSLITGLPMVNAYGILMPDRPLDFSQTNQLHTNGNVLYMYRDAYYSAEYSMTGSLSAGSCTYTRRQGQISRVGALVTFNINMEWTDHTGTGQVIFNQMPFDNVMGTDMPITCYVTGFGNVGHVVALWDVWFRTVRFYRYNTAGEMVPLEMVPNGMIALSGSVLRLSQG